MNPSAFAALIESRGTPAPVAEYQFLPPRRWRFDLCWPSMFIAIEINGLFSGRTAGRHARPMGVQADNEKLTTAAALGWRVLQFTTIDLRRRPVQCAELAAAVVSGRVTTSLLAEFHAAGSRRKS